MFAHDALAIILVTTVWNDAIKSGLRLCVTRNMQVKSRLFRNDDVQIDCINATVRPLVCLNPS